VCEQLEGVDSRDCHAPLARGWMLHAADWSACDLSGSNRDCGAGIDGRRSAVRVCCLVDGWETLM
jgi:hypothetical protein